MAIIESESSYRKSENNGQHECDNSFAINSGQKTNLPRGAHSPENRWGARDNMKVPASDRDENYNGRNDNDADDPY